MPNKGRNLLFIAARAANWHPRSQGVYALGPGEVDRRLVVQVQDVPAFLAEDHQEGQRTHLRDAFARDLIDAVRSLLQVAHVLIQADLLVARFGGVEAQQLCCYFTALKLVLGLYLFLLLLTSMH